MKTVYQKYGSRGNFFALLFMVFFAIFIAGAIALKGRPFVAAGFITALALVVNPRRQERLCAVTLSVPEILADVLDAFILECPQLFGPGGFGTEFTSDTAVLGTQVTAKIAHVPLTGDYDKNNGGFKAAAQDVTTLIEDVPVTLDQFKVVTINISWLTQLASKIDLYREAIRLYGYALGKYVVDVALSKITPANFSNQVQVALANVNLDTFDQNVRDQLNTQKASGRDRFCFLGTPAASRLGGDDRIKSSLFYNMLNGDNAYRRWSNLGGLKTVQEYPDMNSANKLIGFAGDKRSIVVASRKLNFSNAAEKLGVPKVMDFYPMTHPMSGVEMTGVAWQEAGTGDVFVGAGLLFGVSAGSQGGVAGAITDNAGVRIVTP